MTWICLWTHEIDCWTMEEGVMNENLKFSVKKEDSI